MKNRALAISLALFTLAGALWLLRSKPQTGLQPETPSATPSPTGISPFQSPKPVTPSSEAVAMPSAWEQFAEKHGRHLRPEFTSDGRLAAIRGAMGQGGLETSFSPEDHQAVLLRAREIIRDLRSLLRLEDEFPLDEGVAKGNPISAQAYFTETKEGRKIAPYGRVTLSLGKRGELLGLDSDYVPGIVVRNSIRLSVENAREFAARSVPESLRSRGGRGELKLWVNSLGGAEVPEGRYAYEFHFEYMRIIVDAEDGSILYRRDQRSHG